MRCLSGTPPGITRCTSAEVRCKSQSTEHQRSCNKRELISTGRETHEVRIKRMSSAQPAGTFFCSKSVPSFVHAQNLPPDWSNLTWQGTHFTNVTRRQAYKQRMPTDTNGLKLGVDAIRQGVTPLYQLAYVTCPVLVLSVIVRLLCGHCAVIVRFICSILRLWGVDQEMCFIFSLLFLHRFLCARVF